MNDNVNHPSHYADNTSLECCDVMRLAFGVEDYSRFCLMNAFKYLWRYKFKNGKEDLDKAEWYLKSAKNTVNYTNDVDSRHLTDLIRILRNEREKTKSEENKVKEEE